jgi:hypothetical protein
VIEATTPLTAWSQQVHWLREGDIPKDRRQNIRISTKDLAAIQKRALEEGLPYQAASRKLVAQVRVRAAFGKRSERTEELDVAKGVPGHGLASSPTRLRIFRQG